MTKKTNLIGKCLALTNYWSNFFQNFGNCYYLFSKYFYISYLINFLFNKFLINKFLFLKTVSFSFFPKKIIIILSTSSRNFLLLNLLHNFFFSFWIQNFNFLSLKILVFSTKTFYLSNLFLKNYIFYLTKKFNFSPKKILNLLNSFLITNLSQNSLALSNNGLKIKRFIGFKIKLIGRYENTKNSMARSVSFKSGKISSTKLKINIDFVNHFFYTKLGSSNLKIWTFYLIY